MLKEPDFREHLLRQGVAAAEAALRHAHAAEQEAQAKLVGEGTTADDDAYKAENAALVRQGAKGQALVSTEEYKQTHAAFLKEYGPVMREIFIIQTLRDKVISYCDTGVWEKGGWNSPSPPHA